MAELDFGVPSSEAKKLGIEYDPYMSITVKEDAMNLFNQLQNNEISEENFLKDVKTILPAFDDNVYQQTMNPKFFGKETGSSNTLGMLDYVNYLSSQQEKLLHHENKMKYLNTQVPMGDTVDNKGLFKEGFSFKDFALQDDMSRSEFFLTRKNKFLERYPEGAYTMITLTPYGNEPVELFKKNADDKEWNFRLPEGRDLGEFGVFTGNVLNTRNLFATLSAVASRNPTGFKSFSYLVGGDYLGQQVGKTIEQAKGFGEGKYAGEIGPDTVLNYFTNLVERDLNDSLGIGRDVKESFGVGGSQIFLNRIMNYFTKKDKSLFGLFGVTKGADNFSASYEKLLRDGYQIDPIVHAQLLQWPLLRASFFQAKDFVNFPKKTIDNQSIQLYKAFEKFGYKLAAEGGGKGDELSFNQLVKLNKSFEMQLGDLLTPPGNAIEKTMSNQKILQVFKKWDETSSAIEKQLKNSASNMSKIDGINFSAGPLVKLAKELQKSSNVVSKGKAYGVREIKKAREEFGINLAGKNKIVPTQTGFVEPKLNTLINNISKLDSTIIRQKGGKGWSEATDQLLSFRKQALDLTSHPDETVRIAAKEIFHKIKKTSSRPNGASEEFAVAWNHYNKVLNQHDLVRQTNAMKKSIDTGDLDASTFVSRFLSPDLPDTASLLLKMLPDNPVIKDNMKSAFLNQLTKNPTKFVDQFDDWMTSNPEGLTALLGKGVVNELKAMKVISNKYSNPIVQKAMNEAMDEFSPKEFIKFVENIAKSENLGVDKAIQKMMADFGGIDSPAMSQIRGGVIANILRKSANKSKSIYDLDNELAIDPGKLFVEFENLTKDSTLSKIFTKEHLNIIKDFDNYTIAISGVGDIGGPIAAGAERMKILEAVTKPGALISTAKTILSINIMSRLLGSPVTASKISNLGPNVYTEKGILALRNILAEGLNNLAVSPSLLGEIESPSDGMILEFAPSQSKQSIMNQGIKAEQGEFPGSEIEKEKMKIERENLSSAINPTVINPASRLSNPVGMMPTPTTDTGPVNPNTMAKGSQLFSGPREITFAAQGGIMNARKQIQRVA
tara:strand:- start:1456 stop:4644 length:3189 start_codon:yes stop_codon:yes gene_type:complete